MSSTRTFATGATRDTDAGKYDYEGFLCPRVLTAYAAYMHHNREMMDGSLRDSDNWQKGIDKTTYMKSMWRHFMDVWSEHRGIPTKEGLVWALCAILFNAMGLLHELLKDDASLLEAAIYHNKMLRLNRRRAAVDAKGHAADRPGRAPNGCTVERVEGSRWPDEGEPRDVLAKQMLAGDPGSNQGFVDLVVSASSAYSRVNRVARNPDLPKSGRFP